MSDQIKMGAENLSARLVLGMPKGANKATQLNLTKLTWLIYLFYELTNGQAVMHYSRHRLTVSVTLWPTCHVKILQLCRITFDLKWSS